MVNRGQSSFRRILLSRILLLCIPVLLVGEYVTYRKARSGLLETARQNLAESAARKAETTEQWIQLLKSNLIHASENSVLQSKLPQNQQQFIEQFKKRLPAQVSCLQLLNLQTGQVVVSTCGNKPIHSVPKDFWPQQPKKLISDESNLYVTLLEPQLNSQSQLKAATPPTDAGNSAKNVSNISLVLSSPVYIREGATSQLRYGLSIRSALPLQTTSPRRSLAGYTVVIDHRRIILEHPDMNRIGHSISEEAPEDARRLEIIVKNAIANDNDVLHLFEFDPNHVEVLAGYASIPNPISTDKNSKWVILAITRLDYALSGLQDIQKVLLGVIFCLVLASMAATMYLSRDLARPLEKLRDYALTVDSLEPLDQAPQNFKIREFNQLAEAITSMVDRLRGWAEELEKASMEAQVANQLKSEFLANVSHELRTPLNGIIGSIQIVKDDLCDSEEEEDEWLDRADSAAKHLLHIINDILDIAKIESGTLSMLLETINITQIVAEAIDLEEAEVQQQGLELKLPPLDQPILVYADPDKLRQVFLNVLGNAIKFTDEGSISVSMWVEPMKKNYASFAHQAADSSEQPGSESYQVVITVEDTGAGIDPSQQDKLFQPFVMADGSTTRRFGGNGLGLAISKNIMELMEGSISLYSAGLGKGTTVTITLPTRQLPG